MDHVNNKITKITMVDPKLINLMKRGIKNIRFNNKNYKLLGRGGEGNVYIYDENNNIAIKVYHDGKEFNSETVYREIYVVDFLRSIEQIGDHIVNLGEFIETENSAYIFSDLYDGDLDMWVKKATTKNSELSVTEDDWLSMIFQITFAFFDINSRGVLHNDSKPKNIFYKKENMNININTYIINEKLFEISFKYHFYLGDFSHVRIAGLDPDYDENLKLFVSGTADLIYDLTNRSDLYELSRILYRRLVNIVTSIYSNDNIENMIDNYSKIDPEFSERIKKNKENIISKLGNLTIGPRIIKRSNIYELIESNYITIDMVKEKDKNIVFPSKKVQELLEKIIDPNESLETLFDFYLQ